MEISVEGGTPTLSKFESEKIVEAISFIKEMAI
jgi:hypothetical protein